MSRRQGTPRFIQAMAIILGLLFLFTLYYGNSHLVHLVLLP